MSPFIRMSMLLLTFQAGCLRGGFEGTDASRPDARAASDLLAEASSDGDGGPRDVLVQDADLPSDRGASPDGPSAIQVSNLTAMWTTSHSIAWKWDIAGSGSAFSAIRLVVGRNVADVQSRSGSAVIFDEAKNPALGFFINPDDSAAEPLHTTITSDHLPGTAYHGQLIAVDMLGRESVTNITAATTISTSAEIIIFSELPTAGYSLPPAFTHTMGSAYQGDYCYAYTNDCATIESSCYTQLRRENLRVDMSAISESAFDTTAFFEMAVACDMRHPHYSQVRITFGDIAGESVLWVLEPFTIRCDGGYQLLQFPLRYFGVGALMPFGTLAGLMEAFTVGGRWGDGAIIRVDEVRVRW